MAHSHRESPFAKRPLLTQSALFARAEERHLSQFHYFHWGLQSLSPSCGCRLDLPSQSRANNEHELDLSYWPFLSHHPLNDRSHMRINGVDGWQGSGLRWDQQADLRA